MNVNVNNNNGSAGLGGSLYAPGGSSAALPSEEDGLLNSSFDLDSVITNLVGVADAQMMNVERSEEKEMEERFRQLREGGGFFDGNDFGTQSNTNNTAGGTGDNQNSSSSNNMSNNNASNNASARPNYE